jgi:hypothetical protein
LVASIAGGSPKQRQHLVPLNDEHRREDDKKRGDATSNGV